MSATTIPSSAVLRGVVLLVCLIFAGFYGATQTRIEYRDGQPYDAESYVEMASQAARHQPLSSSKPFVYRVALPWMVGTLFPDDLLGGFRTINVITGVLTFGVLFTVLTRFAAGLALGLTLFLFVVNPNGPFRFSHFYPALTDYPALLCILLILFIHHRWPGTNPWKIATTSIVTLLGVAFREIAITAPAALLAVAWLSALSPGNGLTLRQRARALLSPWLIPVAVGIVGIALTRVVVTPVGDYSFSVAALASVRNNLTNPLTLPLALFTCYGPCLVLLVPYWRAVWAKLAEHPEFGTYFMVIAVLAIFGGTHTDRFVYWTFPVVLPLLAVAIGSLSSERLSIYSVTLIASIAVVQILAFRIFGTFPNASFDALASPGRPSLWLFGPFGDDANFAQMYAAYMGSWSRVTLLSQFAGFSCWSLTLYWLHRRSLHRAGSDECAIVAKRGKRPATPS